MSRKTCLLLLFLLVFLFGCQPDRAVIYAPDASIAPGADYSATTGVSALDATDGNLTDAVKVIDGDLDVTTPGRYLLRYEVRNSRGRVTRAKRVVTVRPCHASAACSPFVWLALACAAGCILLAVLILKREGPQPVVCSGREDTFSNR